MREIRKSGSTRGGAPSGPLLLYRLSKALQSRAQRKRLCANFRNLKPGANTLDPTDIAPSR